MEVPIEEMPQPARGRIESLMETVKARCSIEAKIKKSQLIGAFFDAFLPSFAQKQVGDGEIEDWVYDRLKRDDSWIEEMASDLFTEAVATREEAVRAQLCSAIGKDVPEGYELSADEEEDARVRAWESAQSVAETFNVNLRKWIEQVKEEWWREHGGSFVGLNRFNLLKLVQAKIEDFDSWKVEQIAITEFSYEWKEQVGSFWVLNRGGAEVECQMLPKGASPPERDSPIVCETFAGNWYPYEEAVALAHQHPNCPHHPGRSRVKSGSLPPYMAIGALVYRVEELPEC